MNIVEKRRVGNDKIYRVVGNVGTVRIALADVRAFAKDSSDLRVAGVTTFYEAIMVAPQLEGYRMEPENDSGFRLDSAMIFVYISVKNQRKMTTW